MRVNILSSLNAKPNPFHRSPYQMSKLSAHFALIYYACQVHLSPKRETAIWRREDYPLTLAFLRKNIPAMSVLICNCNRLL